jgi:CubicO group peptidase (beta-lactamase class C family)
VAQSHGGTGQLGQQSQPLVGFFQSLDLLLSKKTRRPVKSSKLFQLVIGVAFAALFLVGCDGAFLSSQSIPIENAVDEYITPYVDSRIFSGSVLIAQGENILLSKGYGMANLEHDVPNTPQTKFRLGSITKQFTAMAILMLQEQGQLNVQDSVCDYVPNCPEAWQPITIHHLLTHSSGIPNLTDFPDFEEMMASGSTVSGTINTFIEKPLHFTPGTKFSYSNSGYIVLGHIIEQSVGNPSYGAYVRDNIFQSLNMTNTGYDHNSLVLSDRASGYFRIDPNTLGNADYLHMSVPHAAGALYSTVEDLYLWDRALYTEALVSQSSLDMMFLPDKDEYGYGWFIGTLLGRKVTAHNGGINGFATSIARFVDDDVVIIVLSNIEDTDPAEITQELAEIVFEEE